MPSGRPCWRQSPRVVVRYHEQLGPGQRGVFAAESIRRGHIIEKVPLLLMPWSEVFDAEDRCLLAISPYVFEWPYSTPTDRRASLPLGYGPLYNHSFTPNADYRHDRPDCLVFYAIRDIRAGEEIVVNYNGTPDDKTPMRFEVRLTGSGRAPAPPSPRGSTGASRRRR